MSVNRDICKVLKKQGKWTPNVCYDCRNRQRCKDNPMNFCEGTANCRCLNCEHVKGDH